MMNETDAIRAAREHGAKAWSNSDGSVTLRIEVVNAGGTLESEDHIVRQMNELLAWLGY